MTCQATSRSWRWELHHTTITHGCFSFYYCKKLNQWVNCNLLSFLFLFSLYMHVVNKAKTLYCTDMVKTYRWEGEPSCQSERSGGILCKGIVSGILVIKFRNTKNGIGLIHFSRKLNYSKTLCSPQSLLSMIS